MTEYYRPDYTPEWFHLENYEPLKGVGREEIYHLVKKRSTLYYVVSSHSSPKISYEGSFKKMISSTDALIDICKIESRSVADFSFGDYLQLQEVSHKLGLSPLLEELRLSKDTFMELAKTLGDKNYLGADDFKIIDGLSWTELLRFKKMFEDDCKDILDVSKPIPLFFSDAVTINLNYNDDKIIDDMREWLKQQREGQEDNRLSDTRITGKTGLIGKRVIPCMDLLLWAKIQGFEYPTAELNEMIFPDVTQDDSTFRRNTQKKAIEYLTTKAYRSIL